jgi:hypothetical protein
MALSAPETIKQRRGGKLAFSAQLSEEDLHDPGRSTLILAVRTLTRGFRRRAIESELSNIVAVRLLRVPAPVSGLQARVTEHAIEVSWTSPETEVTSYRIYRKGADASAGFLLRGEARGAAWQDTEFQFGKTYSYRVTALVKEGSSVAESEDSQAIEITPKDTFPPAAPKELTALLPVSVWSLSGPPTRSRTSADTISIGGKPQARFTSSTPNCSALPFIETPPSLKARVTCIERLPSISPAMKARPPTTWLWRPVNSGQEHEGAPPRWAARVDAIINQGLQ